MLDDRGRPAPARDRPVPRQRAVHGVRASPLGRKSAFLSAGIAVAAVVAALAPLFDVGAGQSHGYLFTSIGVTAIVLGFRARRLAGGRPSALVRSVSGFGIGTGVVAIAAMVVVILTAGSRSTLPATAAPPAAPSALQAPAAAAAPADALSAPPTARDLGGYAGTLAFRLNADFRADGTWPEALEQTTTHQVVVPSSGEVLLVVPAGVVVDYQTSSDRSSYALRIRSVVDPTQYADVDSATNAVHVPQ